MEKFMAIAKSNAGEKSKIVLFLTAYSIFLISRFLMDLGEYDSAFFAVAFGSFATVLLWAVCILIDMTSGRRKVFMSGTEKFFFAGISLWLLWAFLANFSGMSVVYLSLNFSSLREFIVVGVFTHTLFLSVKIIKLYDLKSQVIAVTVFFLGMYLLYAFIYYNRGFDFVGSLASIFQKSGRFRSRYGFRQSNTGGRLCLFFFIFTAIYRAILREKKLSNKIRSASAWKKFAFLFPPVMIILLTTASRTSLSSLLLFWLVYSALSIYQKGKRYAKPMLVAIMLWLAFMLSVAIDWEALWNYFWESRGMNYIGLFPLLTAKGAWAAGVGMLSRSAINNITQMPVMDSFYLSILLKTGLIGFIIFFTSALGVTFVYFSNIRDMTETQKFTGAIIVLMYYYAIFEGGIFYGHNALDLVNWILILLCVNEKSQTALNKFRVRKSARYNSRSYFAGF